MSPQRDRRARVLMVVRLFHPWIGGTERQAHALASHLMEAGHDVRVVTGWWFRGTRQRETIDGVPVFRNHTLWEFFGIRGLRKFGGYLYIVTLVWHLCRSRKTYDVIHIHGLGYHTFAAVVAGRLAGRPTLTKLASSGVHSDILRMRNDQRLALSRYMLPGALRSDRFVALNSAIVDELAAAGVEHPRIALISNGVDTAAFVPRSDFTLKDPALILFVGRLDPQKGLDTLIRAFRLLQRTTDRTARLQLLGEGPSRAALLDLVDGLGLEQDVEFLGTKHNVRDYLEQADIFVLPSRAEGMSNALLEAMSCGLPVVATKIPGNLELIEDRVNGLLCNVDDEESLAVLMEDLLEDASLRERLGRAARQKVDDSHDLRLVAAQYADLYAQLMLGSVARSGHARS